MTVTDILNPVLVMGGIGVILGLGLGFAATKFAVEEDPLLDEIRGLLPGANCGGCGFTGCEAFARALLEGKAKPSLCPVGGAAKEAELCGLLGLPVETSERRCAFIRCGGGSSVSAFRYDYLGLEDCKAVSLLAAGGSKACVFGCMGGGTCRAACRFGAISISDGIAVIDNEKCTACGMCVKSCPKNLIVMVPHGKEIRVNCASADAAKAVRKNCSLGCVGCGLCVKACKYGAVRVSGNLAVVDYGKCTQCGECVKKCPGKCISDRRGKKT